MAHQRKLARRACDACKVRKIKCSEVSPCKGCLNAKIDCTFRTEQRVRGPRKIRTKTRDHIEDVQRQDTTSPSDGTESLGVTAGNASLSESVQTPMASLTVCLCVYRLRLFPIWPIVSIEKIMSTLHVDAANMEAYTLANAVGAATIAQLNLAIANANSVIGTRMAEEAERSRLLMSNAPGPTIDSIKVAFFLHVYHENQVSGGTKSLMYLREAITMAQIMGLDREAAVCSLPYPEQQIRRRLVWKLFVTERGVTLLHKLPPILSPSTGFPSIDDNDEAPIYIALQHLINLFWVFDQSGVFDILKQADGGASSLEMIKSASQNCLNMLRQRLQDLPTERVSANDVQRADICVTRQWMLAKIWTLSIVNGWNIDIWKGENPFSIANDFLEVISTVPKAAIESHGQTMEFKVYEIACAVIDALSSNVRYLWNNRVLADDILNKLHRILSSIRGGNETLAELLRLRMSNVTASYRAIVPAIDESPSSLAWPDSGIEARFSEHSGASHHDSISTSHTTTASERHLDEDIIEVERVEQSKIFDSNKGYGITSPIPGIEFAMPLLARGEYASSQQFLMDVNAFNISHGDLDPMGVLAGL